MGVRSLTVTQYDVECDVCHTCEVCYSPFEDVHSKQQVVKWAEMHTLRNGQILCDACHKKRRAKA